MVLWDQCVQAKTFGAEIAKYQGKSGPNYSNNGI